MKLACLFPAPKKYYLIQKLVWAMTIFRQRGGIKAVGIQNKCRLALRTQKVALFWWEEELRKQAGPRMAPVFLLLLNG